MSIFFEPYTRNKALSQVLDLRLLIGVLGEKQCHGWWQTSFFADFSPGFIDPVFSRTGLLARYTGVLEAARRVHDENIGKGNIYHLFRLKDEMEDSFFSVIHEANLKHADWIKEIQSCDYCMGKLLSIYSKKPDTGKGGAVLSGILNDLYTEAGVQNIASMYLKGFQDKFNVFPYFEY